MTDIPRAKESDSTLAFLREGYAFAGNRRRALGSDAFRARLMLTPVIFAAGAEAAEVFYTPDRFTRKKAMPFTVVKLLQDYGSVQVLSGPAHRHRKRMFMGLMGDAALARMVELTAAGWRAATRRAAGQRVELLELAQRVIGRAVLRWSGLSPTDEEADERARAYGAMVTGAGNVGVGAWVRGELLRTRNERWARQVIEDVRAGRVSPGADQAARIIALHRDPEGDLLPVKVAAVELINLFRPAVAIAHFVVHAALALHEHPDWRERLAVADEDDDGGGMGDGAGDDTAIERFVQEVRRLAPFFPIIGGRVREPFEWRGERFADGAWMVLDIYGTNRDPRSWEDADTFRPERFERWDGSPWSFVPQGAGPYLEGHRCPGEWMTIALMKQSVRFLARELDHAVPEQDLSVDLSRIPAIPASRFLMDVRGLRGA